MAGIPSKQFYDVLIAKGINKLYHANSVATSCNFIKHQALLSRGSVDRRGLSQTAQKSDVIDRKYSIWFDVFVDSVDIHHRAGRLNEYGPVTFVFNTEIIRNNTTGKIWATKVNPTKWAGLSEKRRWFQDIDELERDFNYGTFDHMIVFRHCGGEMPFAQTLEKIILDDPKLKTPSDNYLYSIGVGALRRSMAEAGIKTDIEKRNCPLRCTCKTVYAITHDKTIEMFDPLII